MRTEFEYDTPDYSLITPSLPTTLDSPIVHGLFQSFSGNRYLVIGNAEERTVVALTHTYCEPFTVIEPSQFGTEYGCWWVRVWLRPLKGSAGAPIREPGVLRVRGNDVSLRCHTGPGTTGWIPLGLHLDKPFRRSLTSWTIEATRPFFPLFSRDSDEGLGWAILPHDRPPFLEGVIDLLMDV